MVVKSFTAIDKNEAMNQVWSSLGPGATILSERQERLTWYQRIFRRPRYEVVAGVREQPRHERQQQAEPATTREAFEQSMLVPLCREIKALQQQVDSLMKGGVSQFQPATPVVQPAPVADTQALQLAELRRDEPQPAAARLESRLRASGVGEQLARQLATSVLARVGAGAGDDALSRELAAELGGMFKCGASLKKRRGGPKIIVLVGPTGVGKTTTVAKLAASAYRSEHRVAMVAADTFRVGAVDQLNTYSRIMGVPMESAGSPAELAAAVEKLSGYDFIFVDTSGRSPRDSERIDEIRSMLAALQEPDVHLCLSSTTRDEELSDIVSRFSVLPITKIIFTKIDESRQHGCVVNVLAGSKQCLAYFTTGQNVPDDIENASIKKVARMILEDGRR